MVHIFQNALNHLLERSPLIESVIERAAYHVVLHDEYTAEAKKLRGFARDARLNPDKYKPISKAAVKNSNLYHGTDSSR